MPDEGYVHDAQYTVLVHSHHHHRYEGDTVESRADLTA